MATSEDNPLLSYQTIPKIILYLLFLKTILPKWPTHDLIVIPEWIKNTQLIKGVHSSGLKHLFALLSQISVKEDHSQVSINSLCSSFWGQPFQWFDRKTGRICMKMQA